MGKRRLLKSVASAITAGAIGLSSIAFQAFPSLTAFAATGNPAKDYYYREFGTTDKLKDGQIRITVVDSSVYGADRTTTTIQTPMKVQVGHTVTTTGDALLHKVFGEYWDSSLTNQDFLYTPEGLAQFDKRTIYVYDMTRIGGDGMSYDDWVTSKRSFTYDELEEMAGDYSFTGGNSVVKVAKLEVGRGGMLYSATDYSTGAGNDTYFDSEYTNIGSGVKGDSPYAFGWLAMNHWYVMIEDPNAANSYYGYHANIDGVNNEKAWQVVFKWDDGVGYDKQIDLSYDSEVKSNYANGIPLHSEVKRGVFSFDVYDKDLQTFESEGLANIAYAERNSNGYSEKTKYVIYNISSDATMQNGMPWEWASNFANDGTKTGGYVIADRNGDGELSVDEQLTYIPAYTEEDITAAYTKYLSECNSAKDYNGAKAYKDHLVSDGANGDEFIIGNNSAGKPIIPVMVIEPDDNGVVTTGTYGLPVGNYIVLQVRAGYGYYLDQDFRPIVSIGTWIGDYSKNNTPQIGYGLTYFGAIADTWADAAGSESPAALTKNVKYNHDTYSPVLFLPANTGNNINISRLKPSQISYWVSSNGTTTANPAGSFGPNWVANNGFIYPENAIGASKGKYILNKDDERMQPLAGTSAFAVQNPVIRAGGRVWLADSDDILLENRKAGLNLNTAGSYIIIPQGNGDLNGAKFEVTPTGLSANNKLYLHTTGTTIPAKGSYVYTVQDNMLLIPKDDLAIGNYLIKQISAGEGYKVPVPPEGLTVARIAVSAEDKVTLYYSDQVDQDGNLITTGSGSSTVTPSEKAPDYKVGADNGEDGGTMHLPNELVNGGEIYSLGSSTAPDGAKATISVYNISNHYVYVDQDGVNGEERYETYQYTYKNQIANRNLSHEQVLRIVKDWTPCSTITLSVGTTVSFTDTLPYGTYLIVVTSTPPGYEVTGDFMKTDSITEDDDNIEFETEIDDLSQLPQIDTLFVDAQNNIDSIKIAKTVYLRDIVDVSNLVGGREYILYGAIIDKATGNLFRTGAVKHVTGTAYAATGETSSAPDHAKEANQWLTEGERYNVFSDDYLVWVINVRDWAVAINNQTLVNYTGAAIQHGNTHDENGDSYFYEDKAKITATLKYLARGEVSSDLDLDGTLQVYVNFAAMDTRELEGMTFVAYEYLCEYNGAPNNDVYKATNTGGIMAALGTDLIASHRQLSDEDQTVYLPSLDVSAEASYTGAKTIDPSETITGTVSYGNVEVGNSYRLRVWLLDPTLQIVKMTEGGKEIDHIDRDFMAYSDSGVEEFVFDGLDATKYNNQRLTVYARLYRVTDDAIGGGKAFDLVEKGDADSMGYTASDKDPGQNQVDVSAPTVRTTLGDNTGRKTVNFDKTVTLTDTVVYKNLVLGGSYKAVLTLVNEEGIALFDDAGNELIAEYPFVATKTEMTIKIPITFKGTTLRGMNIVAFNDLYRATDNKIALVATEHNPLEEAQTIAATGDGFTVVISTVATNPSNNTHVVAATANSTAVDEINIRNLDPNTQYMIKTQLANAKNGQIITQFSPIESYFETDSDGRAKFSIPFSFNALVFKGQTLVVFQTVYDQNGDEIIAIHNDYTDTNQMLMVPDIDTVATADDATAKTVMPKAKEVPTTNDPNGPKATVYEATILDTIKYTNLIPGNQYQLTTEVVAKKNGASVGSISMPFTPETSSGTTAVSIDLDVTNYRGQDLVVYEVLTDIYSGDEVVTHRDLMDADQTVTIYGAPDDETPKGDTPGDPDNPDNPNNPGKPGDGTNINTGVAENYGLFFGIGGSILAIAGALVGVLIYRRKKNGN